LPQDSNSVGDYILLLNDVSLVTSMRINLIFISYLDDKIIYYHFENKVTLFSLIKLTLVLPLEKTRSI
jgi:hypothetical protein